MKFKSKIAFVTVIIVLLASVSLTYLGIRNTEKLALEMMRNEGFTLVENVDMQVKGANEFSKVIDTFLATKILQASKVLDYSNQELWSNEFLWNWPKI